MSLQDSLAILTFAFAIAGVIFALGKQAQSIASNADDINSIGRKLETFCDRTDRRLDESAKFIVRVDQRVANLERHTFGDELTEFLRSGTNFRPASNDDTEPM
jgi:hypothetical protein